MNRVLKAASDHTPVARIDVMTRPSMNPPADSSMHAESAEAVATHISPVTEDTATAMPGKWTAHSLQTFASHQARCFANYGDGHMKIGFIGLGRMGSAMAANLVKAGHDVTVFNRSPEKRRALVELGAREATSIADACRGEAVITMLADDTAVSRVALANDGVIGSLPRGAIHISMSTISVELSKSLTQAHAEAGQRFVAAPVFGRPDAAAAAKLFVVTAGDAAALEACKPIFNALGQKTIPIGAEPQAANLVKLSGNFLMAAAIEALGEAIALIGKAGIDRSAYVDLLTSTILPAPIYKTYGGLIAANKFQPAAFAAPLGFKDIRLALAAAESLRVPMPLGSLLHDRFLRLLAQGGDGLDWAAIGGLATQDAGDAQTPRG
jgi:3-hydroxyisobutyrate dehydrogenase-like beta-hydroxyacid dehydrogenase